MRRVLAFLLCLTFLPLGVRAEEEKYVALTFDDGPSGRYTRQLLDGLYDRGAKATFFLCGYRMKDYPDITQRIFEEGHEIGCHGYSHDPMQTMSRRDIAAEIVDMTALLPEGCIVRYLRPPCGFVSDGIRQVAEARQMAILSWSVDPRDWETHDAAAIEKAALKNIKDGDIVLLHDMSTSSVTAALAIADALIEQGFTLVTVSQLARLRNTRPKPGQIYRSFPPKPSPSGEGAER